MSFRTVGRRAFLQHGSFCVAIPWLHSLFGPSHSAYGQQLGRTPRRFLAIALPHGFWPEEWWSLVPREAVSPPVFRQRANYTRTADGIYQYNLASLSATSAPPLAAMTSQAFNRIRNKSLILSGIDGLEGTLRNSRIMSGHNHTSFLGGYADLTSGRDDGTEALPRGVSLDNVIAQHLSGSAAQKSLFLQTPRNDEGNGKYSFYKSGSRTEYAEAAYEPVSTWDSLFKSVASQSEASSESIDLAASRRRTLLEGILTDLSEKIKNPRLSSEDKGKLQEYASLIDAQLRVVTGGQPLDASKIPPRTAERAPASAYSEEQMKTLNRAQMANAVGAIKANVAQSVVLKIAGDSDWRPYGVSSRLHEATHEKALTQIVSVHRTMFDWIADHIVAPLDVVEDPQTGATYLDNTLVMISTEHGSPEGHSRDGLGVMFIGGSAFTNWKLGRALEYGRIERAVGDHASRHGDGALYLGRPYTQVLSSVIDAFGIPAETISRDMTMRYVDAHDKRWATEWNKGLPGLS